MTSLKFAETYNVVAFLEKPEESDGFAAIIDFLKASSVSYALTVNPMIYTSCIEQFWATAKVQTVNGVRQIQALVDKKRVIITESSIRRDLYLNNTEVTDCLPSATIFEELARMGAKSTAWNEFISSMALLIICLATNQKFNLSKYIFDVMVKHLDGGVKFLLYPRKDFSRRITPLFDTMMVQPVEEMGEDSYLFYSLQYPYDQHLHPPNPKKDQTHLRKEDLEVRKKENIKTYRVKKTQESGIEDIDVDVDVSLVDETQERQDDDLIFDTRLDDSTAGEAVTTGGDDSVVPTTNEEITLAQTLIQIKAAKPKVVTTGCSTRTLQDP
ncbi:hypothetical protein Tco_0501020 [Tanacetum coccineum]